MEALRTHEPPVVAARTGFGPNAPDPGHTTAEKMAISPEPG